MVSLCDTLTLDRSARICADGSLVAEVFAARIGLQDYLGSEVDPSGERFASDATVKVYRSENEVFKADSLASFAAAPVTINHPSEAVTADNWRGLGVGEINGDIVRDGGRVRVPIIVRDAAAVRAATTTHKQLSMGYATELVFPTDGKHPDGTACDAYQTNLKINHIALVSAARGGPELCVVDERTVGTIDMENKGSAGEGTGPAARRELQRLQASGLSLEQISSRLDAMGESASRSAGTLSAILNSEIDNPPSTLITFLKRVRIGDSMSSITIDGIPVNLSDEAAVRAVIAKKDEAISDLVSAHDRAIAAKDAEIDTLKASQVDQAQIDALADAKASVVEKAKAVCGDKLPDTAGKTVADVRRMACDAKGIEVADKSDDYIEARFDALTADKADTVTSISPKVVNDSAAQLISLRAQRNAALGSAHKGAI